MGTLKPFGLAFVVTAMSLSLARAADDPVPVTIAIIPFSARGGADLQQAEALKGLLIDQLFFGRCVSVAPGSEVEVFLAKGGLAAKCSADSNACSLDAAKLAPTDFIAVGDLMRTGNRLFLSLQVIRSKRQQTVYRQRIETAEPFLTEDAGAVFQHLASGFSCTKEERFSDPPNPLKLVPLNLRLKSEVKSATVPGREEPSALPNKPVQIP